MARLIKHDAQSPVIIKEGDKTIAVCMCGLSSNKPYCDGSHAKTRDEENGKLYAYDTAGKRVEIIKQY
ncbi:CDGSH iron-sulfur domain-containing protein [Candidatus Woesearchaeota archaeon]|nr:CDGSH iron-sulfur domain-containing protein [Candidatus Woesearchaeota archaeon]